MSTLRKYVRSFASMLELTLRTRRTRKMLVMLILTTFAILALSTYLDFRSSQNLRDIAKHQFNTEQLVIARHIKWNIEREIKVILKEIEMITSIPLSNFDDILTKQDTLDKTLQRVIKNGIFRIDVIEPATNTVRSYEYSRQWKVQDITPDFLPDGLHAVMDDPQKIFVSFPFKKVGGIHVIIGRSFAGLRYLLAVELDVTCFLKQFIKNTLSGKTGYAWVVSQDGMFLDHPFTEFIGENAFTARKERNPEISYKSINFIQKNQMLKGQEGTGTYRTGWHRGITGEIEKLIAYSPIVISDDPAQKWSVAVVAPASEIEKYINKTYIWRSLSHVIIMMVVIVAGTTILLNEMRWTRELEHKVSERTLSLKTSEEKYRSLVESAEDFIYTVNRDGKFQSINSFTAGFLGGRPEDFIGKGIDLVFHEETLQKNIQILNLVYRHGRSIRDEFKLQMEGHDLWISVNFMPIREETGAVGSVLCIARDVTHEKDLERQLINAEKLASMGTLAAGVAHEINNPLGIILGFADLLIRKTPKATQAYDDLKTIERQGIHCKQIVENLLRFARFGDGKSVEADLNEEIREIVAIVSHTLEMDNIELNTMLAEGIPKVQGDPRELQQVFLNLINNAASAMKGGGNLTIRSRWNTKTQKAEVQVKDTGHGITREHMDRIFEPFFTTKPEGEGTGLGLAVTYGIVAKYGGTIDCDSISIDSALAAANKNGTVFTIKLPPSKEKNP